MVPHNEIKIDLNTIRPIRLKKRRFGGRLPSISTTAGKALLGTCCLAMIAAVTMAVVIPFGLMKKNAVLSSVDSTTVVTTTFISTTTTSVMTITTTITTATNTITATTMVTYAPVGIYALTIPTCATWNQTGITIAGNQNGTVGSDLHSLSGPVGIFIDNNFTLYIADRSNNRVVKYYTNATTGVLVAGNRTAGSSTSQLSAPRGIAVDQSGAIIIGDTNNYRIISFPPGSTVGTILTTNSSSSPLRQTRDLHIDVNNVIYVTDVDNNQVVKFYPNSGIGVVLAGGNGMGSGATQLSGPFGNCIDANQSLYVVDQGNQRVQKYPPGSKTGVTVAGTNSSSGSSLFQLNDPTAVIIDNNGYIYVADSSNNRVVKWTTNYTAGGVCIVGCTGVAGTATDQLRNARDLKFNSLGNLYVTDQSNNRIQKFLIQTTSSTCSNSG